MSEEAPAPSATANTTTSDGLTRLPGNSPTRYAPIGSRFGAKPKSLSFDADAAPAPPANEPAPANEPPPPPPPPPVAAEPPPPPPPPSTTLDESCGALVQQLRQAVADVFKEASPAADGGAGFVELREGSLAVQCLVGAVERLLGHRLQSTQFGVFRRCVFWHYLETFAELSSCVRQPAVEDVESLAVIRAFGEAVREVRRAPLPKTDGGKGRAFVRLALQRRMLSSFVTLLAADRQLIALWYAERACLRQEDALAAATTVLSTLQAFDFGALSASNALLDEENPFAAET